ncbi:hypothetical protein WICMUC_001646 [Wickerhamomyces mucosus]|uniref:Major facilitator superfamily (MFS) profile domain-containing protein n=1 Tax=Wickerhamomyces mucosus TaxID=1378264 RepID=A0A9P8PU68_9ASCO|nr:hypothetical protein WICMUC_001646 [Wickerhamomyces mucosus]
MSSIKGGKTPTNSQENISLQEEGEGEGYTFSKTYKSLKWIIFLNILCAFPGFAFGWDVGTAGGIVNFDSFKAKFGSNGEFNPWVVGFIIAGFNAGCAFGGLFLSKGADYWGRRFMIFVSMVILTIGTLIQVSATASGKWYQILIGRIFNGLAVGITSVVTPMLVSESAVAKYRGGLVVFYQLFITLGILIGNVTNFLTKLTLNGQDGEWIVPIALNFLWVLIISITTIFMPESAVYYLSKGETEKAKQVTRKVHCIKEEDSFEDKAYVEHLISRRENEAGESKLSSGAGVKWTECFTGTPRLGLRLALGMSVMLFQQFSGANYFFYYGTTLFRSVGLDDSYVTSIILGAVNFVSTFAGIYFVEKFGRRACLLAGSIGMLTCMLIYTCLGSFALGNQNYNSASVGGAMIAFTCIYIFFFATTWGPVAFVVVSELFPARVKAISMSLSIAMNWISNFLISLLTPFIIKAIGFKYGFIFAGFLFVSAIVVSIFLKETKGCTTDEDVDRLYLRSINTTESTGLSGSDTQSTTEKVQIKNVAK